MAKKIKPTEIVEEVKDESLVEASKVGKKEKVVSYPIVVGNGKFQIVSHAEGFLLYNPDGARVSGVETEARIKDLVNRMNTSAGLK